MHFCSFYISGPPAPREKAPQWPAGSDGMEPAKVRMAIS
jgi:hypothetical protein